jgi:hypothetical protein
MITALRQPDKDTCGQTCLAMLLEVDVRTVLHHLPSKESGTRWPELRDQLLCAGWQAPHDLSMIEHHGLFVLPETALCLVAWPKNGVLDGRRHWVLVAEGQIWDPLCPGETPLFLRHGGGVTGYAALAR